MADLVWIKSEDDWQHEGNALWIAKGDLGNYRIVEKKTGECFIAVRSKDGSPKSLGNFSSIQNAKTAAITYENYRNYA